MSLSTVVTTFLMDSGFKPKDRSYTLPLLCLDGPEIDSGGPGDHSIGSSRGLTGLPECYCDYVHNLEYNKIIYREGGEYADCF